MKRFGGSCEPQVLEFAAWIPKSRKGTRGSVSAPWPRLYIFYAFLVSYELFDALDCSVVLSATKNPSIKWT